MRANRHQLPTGYSKQPSPPPAVRTARVYTSDPGASSSDPRRSQPCGVAPSIAPSHDRPEGSFLSSAPKNGCTRVNALSQTSVATAKTYSLGPPPNGSIAQSLGSHALVATTHVQIAAPPERVFAVLADPASYADWVVGSDTVRDADADADWPAVGSRFHYRVGFWLLKVNDHTEVLGVDPPARLVMRARARPLGTARVTMLLVARAGGTYVTMTETAGDPRSRLALNRSTDPLCTGETLNRCAV